MPWFIEDRGVCVAPTVNTQNRVTGHHLVSLGSLNETVVHSREVFRAAIALNAYGVVLMYNHPSGETAPSDADKRDDAATSQCGRDPADPSARSYHRGCRSAVQL